MDDYDDGSDDDDDDDDACKHEDGAQFVECSLIMYIKLHLHHNVQYR